MTAVAAPADRRFRRAHVKPSRRRINWRTPLKSALKAAVVGALMIYAAFRGERVVSHAEMLQVSRITVHGNERLSQGEVVALLNGLRGQSLLWTDLEAWRSRLLASPWVRDAALRRSLPSTIDVVVQERQPVGIGRMGGDMYLVDDRGQAIDQYGPQYADLDLPIIDGLSSSASEIEAEARADLAMRVIAALKGKPDIARRLSQIDVSELHDAAVIVSGDPAVIHLGDEQFLQRLEAYLQLAPTLRDRVADIDYVDLRFDDRIYVRPAGKAGQVQHSGLSVARPAAHGSGGRESGARRSKSTKR